MILTIKNESLSVKVNTLGAELISVMGSKEYLWQNTEAEGWHGHAPILFPACGRCAITVEGKTYSEMLHGFARKFEFDVIDKGEDFISLTLNSNEETLKLYPFSFSYNLTYALVGKSVKITHTVSNTGTKDLYFAYGGHESFNLDKGKDYFIKFPKEEKFVLLSADNMGRLNGKSEHRGNGKLFTLDFKDLENDETIIFEEINSETATICDEDGQEYFSADFPGINHLLIWQAGDYSICIEPWYNLPDSVGETKDLSQKQVICLAPGKIFSAERSLNYLK